MAKSILREKSYSFAIRIVKLCQELQGVRREFVLSKQLIRSGTAIGALVREAEFGQTRADFASKLSIALKEANETDYWLLLMYDTGYIQEKQQFLSFQSECKELIAMLVSSVKKVKSEK